MTYSHANASAPRVLGEEIPPGIRRSIASWFNENGVNMTTARKRFFQKFGYGDVDDVAADIGDRWGGPTRERFYEDVQSDPAVTQWNYGPRRKVAGTAVAQFHVPAPLYLDYLSKCIDLYVEPRRYVADPSYLEYMDDPYLAPVQYLNELFAARGISYRFDMNGDAEWHGDRGAYAEVVRPALDALDDPRLAGCRAEFDAALRHLLSGTPKDHEDAIEEAGKSVESAMKIVLDARNVPRTGGETAEPLWNLLRDNGVLPPKTKDAILATSRLRNEYGGHGQGGVVRVIPDGIPELAVRSAATAITYLGGRLP